MIAYLCDCRKKCADSPGCFKNGMDVGFCRHTTDPKHALNGECAEPQNHPERFNAVYDKTNDAVMYYIEKETWRNENVHRDEGWHVHDELPGSGNP